MNKWYLLRLNLLAVLLILVGAGVVAGAIKSTEFPAPGVIDQITHDRGNLVTTVNNFGYIGGYSWAGRPSGRWPANSDHDYLAEMTFWIGGLDSANNVLLANTTDDFNPMLNWSAAEEPTDFRLSTDTTSYAYDASDTAGAGIGFPANGWQVWDAVNEIWGYNQVYNSLDSTFYDGGPVGVQESICRFKDDGTNQSVMGLEITQTIRQWNYSYNQDMIFINFTIKNASNQDYHDVALGLYCDFDIGGNDQATGENGRLGDLVNSDSALSLAWTYDQDGYDPGWGSLVSTGMMGTVVLSTPGDIGMTSFNTGQWENLPSNDLDRYAMINNTEFDSSLPPTDQYYVQAVRGISLNAGQTIQFDFAIVAAPNEEKLNSVALRAKQLFDNYFIGAAAPNAPLLQAVTGDHAVTLFWDNKAELSIEPTTGEADFGGYEIFRSTDRGLTWGTLTLNDDNSIGPDYNPMERFIPDQFGRIQHRFSDSILTNGMEYWYSVVAYDTGVVNDSGIVAYDTLKNARSSPESATNTVRVIPRDNPIGYDAPKATVAHTNSRSWYRADGNISVTVVDDMFLTGDTYQVSFVDDCLMPQLSVVNTTTGDTLVADSIAVPYVYDKLEVVDGLQINITQPDSFYPDTSFQSGFAISGPQTLNPTFVEQMAQGVACYGHMANDIEIRYTASGQTGYSWWDDGDVPLPFEVWNTTDNVQVGVWVVDWADDHQYDIADEDYLVLTNYDTNDPNFLAFAYPDYLTWILAFDISDVPADGDVYTIQGPGLLTSDDQFTFTADKHAIIASEAKADLKKIHVVPNPYMGYAKWETGFVPKIQFVDLPEKCTIRIYTLSGEQISTVEHDGAGSEDWNLQSEAGRGIASGIYLYHVESEFGNYTGKFAVIR